MSEVRRWLEGIGLSQYADAFRANDIGGQKTSRDSKKDCGKPGCPNDHRSQSSPVATRIE
ncbi:SAM domain-containing protein [Bradyrhizobium sp. AZCC 2289]|uniref:SAM domain-containing protein n=1 Tax=Bradyrhizobium sp. AZCC 2289 TaxID=3117026 RepID=UPI00306AAD47